jgi:hypothetical protein
MQRFVLRGCRNVVLHGHVGQEAIEIAFYKLPGEDSSENPETIVN